jgi:uncharacterized membrane protein YgaE (UPF0421/DUF939 family)
MQNEEILNQLIISFEKRIKALEEKFKSEIKAKDREIKIYKEEIAFLRKMNMALAQKNITYNSINESKSILGTMSETFNNDLREAKIGNFANQVQDNARQQTNQYNYAPEKQTLAEAADEIQRLLKQLEETNPTATEPEQIAYVNVAAKPYLKQRVIAALKAGGDTAIDEFFLENKYLKVGKAVIKAWLQPSS